MATSMQTKFTALVDAAAAKHGLEVTAIHSWPNVGKWLFQPAGSLSTCLTIGFYFSTQTKFDCDEPIFSTGPADRSNPKMCLAVKPDEYETALAFITAAIAKAAQASARTSAAS